MYIKEAIYVWIGLTSFWALFSLVRCFFNKVSNAISYSREKEIKEITARKNREIRKISNKYELAEAENKKLKNELSSKNGNINKETNSKEENIDNRVEEKVRSFSYVIDNMKNDVEDLIRRTERDRRGRERDRRGRERDRRGRERDREMTERDRRRRDRLSKKLRDKNLYGSCSHLQTPSDSKIKVKKRKRCSSGKNKERLFFLDMLERESEKNKDCKKTFFSIFDNSSDM